MPGAKVRCSVHFPFGGRSRPAASGRQLLGIHSFIRTNHPCLQGEIGALLCKEMGLIGYGKVIEKFLLLN